MTTLPAGLSIRPATEADLPAINDIFYQSEIAGAMYVAELADAIVGCSGSIARGNVVFLTDLFVRPQQQSSHVGRMLLRHVLLHDGRTLCTVASTDPRALSRYVREGMRPRLPVLYLRGDVPALGPLPTGDVAITIVEAAPDDRAFATWDAEIGGRPRPQEIAFWRRAHNAVPVWFQRGGATIGYGVFHQRSGGSLWTPDAITLGPIGVRDERDAAACVLAAVAWARARNDNVRLTLIGPHPALAPLLDAHFRLVEVETFCCSTAPFFDPGRYLPSGADLL
jgi:Acetyltransferase (GNAT) family